MPPLLFLVAEGPCAHASDLSFPKTEDRYNLQVDREVRAFLCAGEALENKRAIESRMQYPFCVSLHKHYTHTQAQHTRKRTHARTLE